MLSLMEKPCIMSLTRIHVIEGYVCVLRHIIWKISSEYIVEELQKKEVLP